MAIAGRLCGVVRSRAGLALHSSATRFSSSPAPPQAISLSGQQSKGNAGSFKYFISNERAAATSPPVQRVLSLENASTWDRMAADKKALMSQFMTRPEDTGASDVQIAALTVRITYATNHMGRNHKDNRTKRGLEALVQRRRKLLIYLKRTDFPRYRDVVMRLGLRPV